ncbi:MAG: MerC domain-containing protein [Haliscomenobacter sp.]|nr:MerC domain-containing protein [Haliscomenobacter sp.]
MTKFFSWHWDIAGFGASLLCAIHCMLMPLVLALGMFAGAHWLMNPITDWIFIGTSAVIASWSLLQSYFRKHRNLRPLWISGMGFLGLIAAQNFLFPIPIGSWQLEGDLLLMRISTTGS